MQIPYIENIFINKTKVKDYLLSEIHNTGKYKARFFLKIGFEQQLPEILITELISIAENNNLIAVLNTEFGTKYTIEGFINAPNGKKYFIRTIWIIHTLQKQPYLITAYPA